MTAQELMAWDRDLRAVGPGLSDRHAEACARLAVVLLCGEQSAVRFFAREVAQGRASKPMLTALVRIEQEEALHESAVDQLCRTLPQAADAAALRRRARRFFLELGRIDDVAQHFSHIALLDGGVCRILSAIEHSAISAASPVRRLASLIKLDEARHVAVSRRYASAFGPAARGRRDMIADLGARFAGMLAPLADDFEALGICSDGLFSRIRRDGLR